MWEFVERHGESHETMRKLGEITVFLPCFILLFNHGWSSSSHTTNACGVKLLRIFRIVLLKLSVKNGTQNEQFLWLSSANLSPKPSYALTHVVQCSVTCI